MQTTEVAMKTDAALLREARSDPAAFRELYERHARPVHGFHLRRTHDEHAALDLTAETFAQAWLGRARFRDEAGGSAGPWLFGIARNLLAQSVRRRAIELAACDRLGGLKRLEREPGAAASASGAPASRGRPGWTDWTKRSTSCPRASEPPSSSASSRASTTSTLPN